jgi:DnaJ-class molecular chaperone
LQGKRHIINESRGDVKIHITIKNETDFIRKGLDIYYTKDISLKDALIGFSFELHHISGKKYTINNNTGKVITNDYKKMVKNMGIRRERQHPAPPMVGNLIISFKIKFPEELTKEQREAIESVF